MYNHWPAIANLRFTHSLDFIFRLFFFVIKSAKFPIHTRKCFYRPWSAVALCSQSLWHFTFDKFDSFCNQRHPSIWPELWHCAVCTRSLAPHRWHRSSSTERTYCAMPFAILHLSSVRINSSASASITRAANRISSNAPADCCHSICKRLRCAVVWHFCSRPQWPSKLGTLTGRHKLENTNHFNCINSQE